MQYGLSNQAYRALVDNGAHDTKRRKKRDDDFDFSADGSTISLNHGRGRLSHRGRSAAGGRGKRRVCGLRKAPGAGNQGKARQRWMN